MQLSQPAVTLHPFHLNMQESTCIANAITLPLKFSNSGKASPTESAKTTGNPTDVKISKYSIGIYRNSFNSLCRLPGVPSQIA